MAKTLLLCGLVLSISLATACEGSVGSRPDPDVGVDQSVMAEADAAIADAPGDDMALRDSTDPTPDTAPSGPAYLHADLWSTWWNDRTRCGAERSFLEICQKRQEPDCSIYQAALAACDPTKIVYGQVGPEKAHERLCRRGKHPDVGGCIAATYDFNTLRYWWYGAEWQGNWPVATLKLFPAGKSWQGGGELIALSSHPNTGQAAMSGIANHGLGHGCAMAGKTSGDAAYQTPFGGFAWIEVPVGQPLTIAALAATNFGGQGFAGCHRGSATQSPWVKAPPGAQLGCVYVLEQVTFEPGRHYLLRYGKIQKLPLGTTAPPQDLVSAFARQEIGVDVSQKATCAL